MTITLPNASFRARLVSIDAGADFQISVKSVSDTVASYTSTLQADGGQGFPVQTISPSLATYLIAPDIPLLRDIDDTAGAASRVYLAGGGHGEPGWRGAVVYTSADGTAWTGVAGLPAEAAYGTTMNACWRRRPRRFARMKRARLPWQ